MERHFPAPSVYVGRGRKPIILAIFSRKLHEIEKKLDRDGALGTVDHLPCTAQPKLGAYRNGISVYVCTFGLWNVMFQSCMSVCSHGGDPIWQLPMTRRTSPYNLDFTVQPLSPRHPRPDLAQYGCQAGGCHPTEMPSRLFLQVRSLRRRIRKRTNRTPNHSPSTTSSAETSRQNPSPVNGLEVSTSRSFTSVWVQGH